MMLVAIDICRGYVEAQHEYALQKARWDYDAKSSTPSAL
jgi:hypothetical protein